MRNVPRGSGGAFREPGAPARRADPLRPALILVNADIEARDAQLDRGRFQFAVMLGAVERSRQIGKAPMPVPRAAFQRPVSGVVAGDRKAVLRSRACHRAGPCLLPVNANSATGMKV